MMISRAALRLNSRIIDTGSILWHAPRIIFVSLSIQLVLAGCQSNAPIQINLVSNGRVQSITTNERMPLLILTAAGVSVQPDDMILADGSPVPLDQPMTTNGPATLQIHKALDLSLNEPGGSQTIRTSSFTFGEALAEHGLALFASDLIEPNPESEILASPTVRYNPARKLDIFVDGKIISVRSAANTVGEALAETGMPLTGLDQCSPAAEETVPEDGQIRIVRVSESFVLNQKSIPYTTQYQDSADLEWGQQEILQPGQNGLAVTRTRVRYEDGVEVSRVTEAETMVRPPQVRIAERGTQIPVKTTSVDGVSIQYWHTLQMYATSYSPCRSGVQGQCFNGTAGGYPLHQGVVAMYKEWFNVLRGSEVYVPGYGRGVIGDLGGGFPDNRPWIDLGYSDNDWQTWSGYVTVYFLAPAPASIPYFMQ